MIFYAEFEKSLGAFSLSVSEYTKFISGYKVKLNRYYKQVLPVDNYVLMYYNEHIEFYETDFKTLIRNATFSDIIALEVYNNSVYILYGDYYRNISVNSPYNSYNFSVDPNCSMISFCENIIICGSQESTSFYFCINQNCTFSSNILYNSSITSMAAMSDSIVGYCNLYILSENTTLYGILFSDIVYDNQIQIYDFIKIPISPALKIYVTPLRIYTIFTESLTIYSSSMVNETEVELNITIQNVFLLENFVYITTNNNSLMIIDGLESIFNVVTYIYNIPDNCNFSSAWFNGSYTNIGFICYNDTEYFLATNLSSCPQKNSQTPCQVLFYLEFYIETPEIVESPVYYYNATFNAQNQKHIVPLYVAFELLIFGQVIHYSEPINNIRSISTYYDNGLDLTYILSGFAGNNLNYKLNINGKEIIPKQSANDPLKILPNVFEINEYTSNYNILSITSVANTPYVIIYNDHAQIIILNTSDYKNGERKMSVVNIISFQDFDVNLICPGLQYVATKNESFLLAATCVWEFNFLYYWQSMPGLYTKASNYFIALLQISLINFEFTWYQAFQIPFQPSKFKPVTDDNSKFTILLLDYYIDHGDSIYKNNRLYISEFTWNNTVVEIINHQLIDVATLGLNAFYVYSMDGYYYDEFYIVLAEKSNGLLVLDSKENQAEIIASIPPNNDPIYTVGVSYKTIYTVAKSGILTIYALLNHSSPVFSCNRYPFAQASTISTISSFVSINDYYWPHFLIYLVIYNNTNFYLRLVNLDGTALSFLITDMPFSINKNNYNGSYEMLIAFINQTSFAFIYNLTSIKYYYIDDYKLIVPKMTESEYNMMKNKWNKTKFYFNAIGENENNYMITEYYTLTIMDYNKKSSDVSSLPIWLFPAISIGVLLILVLSVKVIYKIIFRRRTRVETNELEIISIIPSFIES
ncbi:hypothetical protein SteCoe_38401 [Stentor coeruleus]|uniref:Uncharacterized protein n=1 Tax=Stentor coeruleus TaxID=5963 RepID=A0A1R2ALJ1_9CILI|nr:hypothetical protein SteCoe_38401 [Stentor coeruleus]